LDKQGRLLFAGTGCLLLDGELMQALKAPWFRTDTSWSVTENQGFVGSYKETRPYGGHDIDFFANLRQEAIPTMLADVVCKHLRVVKWGEPNTNNGCHIIQEVA
jgi:hypothetical protein